MPRVTSPAALDRFLAELGRTGRLRRAAACAHLSRSGLYKRIARDPAFARRCAAALARHARAPYPRRRIGRAAERRFLAALMRGATVRDAAGATGFSHPSFYVRAHADPRFDARMAAAQSVGADRRTLARLGRFDDNGGWRSNVDLLDDWCPAYVPMPPMAVDQAILQLIFHNPDGAFQRSRRERRGGSCPPPPLRLEDCRAAILAKLDAFVRLSHFRATGRWLRRGEGMPRLSQA